MRRGVLDGMWLGLLLAVLFWSQTDGMRFTTTAKSGFITGLYVLFTPLIAAARRPAHQARVGDRSG